jgi:hypothetical protein
LLRFKKIFKKEETPPKCSKCGLIAIGTIQIIFNGEVAINGRYCASCEEELHMGFNPLWLPPLVFEE